MAGIQNGLRFGGKLPGRSQFQILLVGFGAAWRQNVSASLAIDGDLPRQALSLEVIRERVLGVGRDGLVGRGNLSVGIAYVLEDDGLVGQVEGSFGRIGLDGEVILGGSVFWLVITRVCFADTCERSTDQFGAGLL